MCGRRGPASASCPSQCGCLRVRLSCCSIKRVSISCHPGLSLVLGPRLGTGSFSDPHTPRHTPLAAVQRPCAGRPAVLFHAFSTKRLFLHPGHVRAPSAGVGGGRGAVSQHTGCVYQAPSFPHCLGVLFVSHPCDLHPNGALVAEPLVQLPPCEVCVWQPGCGESASGPMISVVGHRGLGSCL